MILIHCRDSCSAIVIMIVLFTIMTVIDIIFEGCFVVYKVYFMQMLTIWFLEYSDPHVTRNLKYHYFLCTEVNLLNTLPLMTYLHYI